MIKKLTIVTFIPIILSGCSFIQFHMAMKKNNEEADARISEETLKINQPINEDGFTCLAEYLTKEYQNKFTSCADIKKSKSGEYSYPSVSLRIDHHNKVIYKSRVTNFISPKEQKGLEERGQYCFNGVKNITDQHSRTVLFLRNSMIDESQMFIEIENNNTQELKIFFNAVYIHPGNNLSPSEYSKNQLPLKSDQYFQKIISKGISKCYK